MIVDREDRAVFTDELRGRRRRRGRPRLASPMVRTSVRLPEAVFDACCRKALADGVSLPAVVREALRDQVTAWDARHFPSSSNHDARLGW